MTKPKPIHEMSKNELRRFVVELIGTVRHLEAVKGAPSWWKYATPAAFIVGAALMYLCKFMGWL